MIVRLSYALLDLPVRLRQRLALRRLRQYCCTAEGTEFSPQTIVHNPFGREVIQIGAHSLFMGEINVISAGAKISIGDWCFVGPTAKLWAMESIDIGNRVFISHGVQVFDNNSHSLSASERHERFKELLQRGHHLRAEKVEHRPIRIEDDVWIGFNAAIMKGVTVGRGAIVGACAVITKDVEPFSVVVGNPARKVGDSRE